MTDREIMQMALDDLECLAGYADRAGKGADIDWASVSQDIGQDARKTMQALRDQLAQPERKWAGLESEESIFKEATKQSAGTKQYSFMLGAKWAEAQLKEKND